MMWLGSLIHAGVLHLDWEAKRYALLQVNLPM